MLGLRDLRGARGRLPALRLGSWAPTPGRAWLLAVAAGVLLGVGHLHPALWVGPWLGLALLVVCLSGVSSRLGRAGVVVLVPLLMHVVGFYWILWMFPELVYSTQAQSVAWSAGLWLLCTLPLSAPLAAVAGFAPRWLLWLGVPVAWALGEGLRAALFPITTPDWLVTQSEAPGVLRAVGQLGWWPTLLLCLLGACGLGEAVVRRERRVAALPVVVLAGFWALPALPKAAPELLAGVGVVHTDSTLDLPHTLPDSVELLVWPEGALDLRPTLIEGEAVADLLPPLVPGTRAVHLVGMITSLPGLGRQNQLVQLAADGAVEDSRAKRVLLPVAERRFLGLGIAGFRPGRLPSKLTAAGRAVLPSICGELLDRAHLWAGYPGPDALLVVPARDRVMPGVVPRRQLLAIQRLRSAELGIPSVRASLYGWSNLIDADGAVIAVSKGSTRHILHQHPLHGPQRHDFRGRLLDESREDPPVEARVAVLYDADAPSLRTRCPEGLCVYYTIEEACSGATYDTVVVAGHAEPPRFLGTDAQGLADAIRCVAPSLVVVDACYGASLPLLEALAPTSPLVVAAPSLIPEGGLNYGPAFFGTASAEARAGAVGYPGGALTRVRPDAALVGRLRAELEGLDNWEIDERLVRRSTRTLRLELDDGGGVLASAPLP